MSANIVDPWNQADAYERYIGRWSRPVGHQFVAWLEATRGLKWLDVGCGTGALCGMILQQAQPEELLGIDRSADYIGFARTQVKDPRVRFATGDAVALPVGDGLFDVSVSGLVLNFIPEPGKAVAELVRVTHSGGTVAAYVWDYASGMRMIRYFWDAALALDPAAAELDEAQRFPICQPDALVSLFSGSGLSNVAVTAIDVPTWFRDFDDYWSPFMGGQGPAPGYVRSLTDAGRVRLREALRERVGIGPEGTIQLRVRAWAIKGTKGAHQR
jgi:SAM-dependent methyltransferase